MLTNKFGCRRVLMLGGFMSGLGMALSYFAANLYYLFFTFGVLAGKFEKYGAWLQDAKPEIYQKSQQTIW